MPLIEKLTPEQEALIPVYREKWRKIGLSTEPIDREKATEAVKNIYKWLGEKEPEIYFYNSPRTVCKELLTQLEEEIERQSKDTEILEKTDLNNEFKILELKLGKALLDKLNSNLITRHNLWRRLGKLEDKMWDDIYAILKSHLIEELWIQMMTEIEAENILSKMLSLSWEAEILDSNPYEWVCYGGCFDFCISVLNHQYDLKNWQIFQALANNFGWILPWEKVCFVCDRPRILSFDNQQRLHAEGSPAIQFADGFSVYAYHGVRLPEKYGKVHPSQWRSEWLLTEENAELRRVLIQGIGYARICQELQAIELDSWQEYSLLKIDNDIDVEPIYMLKMSCPSTGYIHALRVPPDMQTAREAIKWVNWGIDPEEFAVQT